LLGRPESGIFVVCSVLLSTVQRLLRPLKYNRRPPGEAAAPYGWHPSRPRRGCWLADDRDVVGVPSWMKDPARASAAIGAASAKLPPATAGT
jgi:hypothetical protein